MKVIVYLRCPTVMSRLSCLCVVDMLAQQKPEEDNGDEFVVWNVDGTSCIIHWLCIRWLDFINNIVRYLS